MENLLVKRVVGDRTASTVPLPLFSTASLPVFFSVSVSLWLFEMGCVSMLSVATGLVGVYAGEVGGDAMVVGDGGWLIIVGEWVFVGA